MNRQTNGPFVDKPIKKLLMTSKYPPLEHFNYALVEFKLCHGW
jgi:hypothetical protein